MARSNSDARKWDPPKRTGGNASARKGASKSKPKANDLPPWDESPARGKGTSRSKSKANDLPPWDEAPARGKGAPKSKSKASAQPPVDESPAKGRARSGASSRYAEDMRAAHGSMRAPASGGAQRDGRVTLTLTVSGDEGDQFDVLCDGRAYGGGCEPPYKFEMRLEPGEHEVRVRRRHAMDRQPSRFVPLPLLILLGDGRCAEYGPYCAVLDLKLALKADCKLNVRYGITGRVGRKNGVAQYVCQPGKGLECEVLDSYMCATPRLRRRWIMANYLTLIALALIALTVVALGAIMCVRQGGSLGGGIMVGLVGVIMAVASALMADSVHTALDGGYAPDIEMPPEKRRRAPKSGGSKAAKGRAGKASDEPNADGDAPKRTAGRGSGKARAKSDAPRDAGTAPDDYDGAYDEAGEMQDFEESQLATADLSPEQLRAAKRQLLKKLGASEEDAQ